MTETRQFEVTARNKVTRVPDRAHYDEATVYAILDQAWICHIGLADESQPIVIPMFFARVGDEILIHSANQGRMARHLESGAPVCVTVTLVDGLVLARSAFHHTMNYRSAVVFGTGRRLVARDEISEAVFAIVEKVVPGRAGDCRLPSPKELGATSLFAIRIESASAKIRTGGPVDEEEDMALPHWAGVIPLREVAMPPEADAALHRNKALPSYLAEAALLRQGDREE